jgi:hypothetical protein
MGETLRFSKKGREIKAAVTKRIEQLRQRLSPRNAALEVFLNDRSLVRSYLVRIAGDRTGMHSYHRSIPLHPESDIASEQIEEIRKVCERIYELEQEMGQLRLVTSHLADEEAFDLGYDDLVAYGFEA